MFRRKIHFASFLLLLSAIFWAAPASAQLSEAAAWAAATTGEYRVVPNITYLTANNFEAKLDVYLPANLTAPNPVLIYIHGGGWVFGSKETAVPQLLPYLEMGWTVVNVGYRLGRVSPAPAAVEDCRCALRWVIRNAEQYKFDTSRIVVTGHSAGGHLSLTTAMLPASAGLDRQCPGNEELKVAAVVNWFGITDVNDLLDGANMQSYAVAWLGSQPDREEISRRVSPLQYVRAGLPPILTIHGDADNVVPYAHATRLQAALEKAGVPHQLITIPGGRHGGFSRADNLRIYAAIREFLTRQGLLKATSAASPSR